MAATVRSTDHATAVSAARGNGGRGARLSARGGAVRWRRASRRAGRRPQLAVLSAAAAAHPRFRGTLAVQVLYEEEGDLKVGTVLAQAPASYQVESPHGRRSKVKQGNVLLTFDSPGAGELLEQA